MYLNVTDHRSNSGLLYVLYYVGHIYGPQNGKIMNLFIDDLHLPVVEDNGTGLGNVSEVCTIYVCVCARSWHVCACVYIHT